MPIKLEQELLSLFSKKDLFKITKYRKICLYLSLLGMILNFVVYVMATYLGFIYWGSEGYYYDYYLRLKLINISYYLTWTAIYLASFCILLHILLLRLTINPHYDILKNRKVKKVDNLEELFTNYRSSIRYRIYCLFILIIIMIIELNYYPRNTQLFYPFIGCDSESGICIITQTVFLTYILAMTVFISIGLSFYIAIIAIDRKEMGTIRIILEPLLQKKKEEKDEQKKIRREMTIEEKRKLKIEEIREKYERSRKNKEEKYRKKFDDMLKKEQFGSKAFKKSLKTEKVKQKQKEKVLKSKRKDEYDFT
ncbi:MAG: hypothetical protein ACTSR8_00685 [Promethearchaeota archaeon]